MSEQEHFVKSSTFAMIKPDATARNLQDDMIKYIQSQGFAVIRQYETTLTRDQAEWLYREHAQKDWFEAQIAYVTSGPVVCLYLERSGIDAAVDFRLLMGPTDHTKAEPHTLRAKYAVGYRENSIHGSDSEASALMELEYFFNTIA